MNQWPKGILCSAIPLPYHCYKVSEGSRAAALIRDKILLKRELNMFFHLFVHPLMESKGQLNVSEGQPEGS